MLDKIFTYSTMKNFTRKIYKTNEQSGINEDIENVENIITLFDSSHRHRFILYTHKISKKQTKGNIQLYSINKTSYSNYVIH